MKYRILFLGLSLLLYGIALALPCLLFNIVPIDPAKVNVLRVYEMKGIELTIAGIIGLLFLQVAAIGWFATIPETVLCPVWSLALRRRTPPDSLFAVTLLQTCWLSLDGIESRYCYNLR